MSGAFAGERAVIVGLGVSGRAAVEVLLAEGAEVRVTEERTLDRLGSVDDLEALGVQVRAGGHQPEHLDGATLVVPSPGVAEGSAVLSWAGDRALPVLGELELGARLARVPYLAVTGTNGKTTATGLITSCLRAAGFDAVGCGNIGHPFPLAAREAHDALVVEASSFQLRFQDSFHPRVSVLLNVSPDHLDWHGSFERYAAAKARIFENQRHPDVHVGNRDDAEAARISASAPCETIWFRSGLPQDGECGFDGSQLLSRIDAPTLLGPVNGERTGFREDVAAAAAAVLSFGAPPTAVSEGIDSFEPPSHRGEIVAAVDGVRFIDNSKATNVHAALAAIASAGRCVLIAGGVAKGADLSPLAAASDRLAAVIAIGEAADELVSAFEGKLQVRKAGSMEEAARVGFELAPRPGTVLLAPACASWDMFTDYEERGERFIAEARSIEVAHA